MKEDGKGMDKGSEQSPGKIEIVGPRGEKLAEVEQTGNRPPAQKQKASRGEATVNTLQAETAPPLSQTVIPPDWTRWDDDTKTSKIRENLATWEQKDEGFLSLNEIQDNEGKKVTMDALINSLGDQSLRNKIGAEFTARSSLHNFYRSFYEGSTMFGSGGIDSGIQEVLPHAGMIKPDNIATIMELSGVAAFFAKLVKNGIELKEAERKLWTEGKLQKFEDQMRAREELGILYGGKLLEKDPVAAKLAGRIFAITLAPFCDPFVVSPVLGKFKRLSNISYYYIYKDHQPGAEILVGPDKAEDGELFDHGFLGVLDFWRSGGMVPFWRLNFDHIGGQNRPVPKDEDVQKWAADKGYASQTIDDQLRQKYVGSGDYLNQYITISTMLNADLSLVDWENLDYSYLREKRAEGMYGGWFSDIGDADETRSGLLAFIKAPNFVNANKLATLYKQARFFRDRAVRWARSIATERYVSSRTQEITGSRSAIFKNNRDQILGLIKFQVSGTAKLDDPSTDGGLFNQELFSLYGIDFADGAFRQRGVGLQTIVDKLYQVHGEEALRLNYKGVDGFKFEGGTIRLDFIWPVLQHYRLSKQQREERERNETEEQKKKRGELEKAFLERFQFRSYVEFEEKIIENPLLDNLNTRSRGLEEILYISAAKRCLLSDDNKGIHIEDPRHPGRRIPLAVSFSGGQPRLHTTKEGEYVDWLEISDPAQSLYYMLEYMVYKKNFDILDLELRDNSPEFSDNSNNWYEPSDRWQAIDGARMKDEITDDQAKMLMEKYDCGEAARLWWGAKSIFFGNLGPLQSVVRGTPFAFVGNIPVSPAGFLLTSQVIGRLINMAEIALTGSSSGGAAGFIGGIPAVLASSVAMQWLARQKWTPRGPWFWLHTGRQVGKT
ncbi:hypothetical protein HY388_01495 [Candidatus Daviesbacteria bacterium]|nr:hypothetical protein [Candidatus Daviesbacteria bacterium]